MSSVVKWIYEGEIIANHGEQSALVGEKVMHDIFGDGQLIKGGKGSLCIDFVDDIGPPNPRVVTWGHVYHTKNLKLTGEAIDMNSLTPGLHVTVVDNDLKMLSGTILTTHSLAGMIALTSALIRVHDHSSALTRCHQMIWQVTTPATPSACAGIHRHHTRWRSS